MVTSELKCGIGNLMFQIAAAVSLALDNNDLTCFDISDHQQCGQGYLSNIYKDNILSSVLDRKINCIWKYIEPNFSFSEITYQKDIKLIGFFQSEKYFFNNKDYIIGLFSPTIKMVNKLNCVLKKIRNNKEVVSLHVRRGDYLKNKDTHRFIGLDYIVNSLKLFVGKTVLVFSDDIVWCKENIPQSNDIIFIDNSFNLADYEQLYLMSMCNHNIISNSTFSWWGSYLNKNKDKIVVAPKKWFCDGYVDSYEDIYTNNMIRL